MSIDIFDQYAWPLGPNVYAIWDEEPKKWRPINHSCDPNCWMQGLDVVARRPIKKDEELTLNYSTFAPEIPPFDCWCGSANCQKRTEYVIIFIFIHYIHLLSPIQLCDTHHLPCDYACSTRICYP
jgi:hypothetical protein